MSNGTACDNGFVLALPILLFCPKFVYFSLQGTKVCAPAQQFIDVLMLYLSAMLPDCCVGQSLYILQGQT